MPDVTFEDQQGQTLTKQPGEVDGGSVTLHNLQGCSVYILDNSTSLIVSGCNDCQLFVGPVAGIASFTDVSGGKVGIAAQEFQAKRCSGVEFGLYSAGVPQVSGSSGLSFKTWTGAYPQLSSHFAAAGLDPSVNRWSEVKDTDSEDGGASDAFQISEASDYWEVPIDGFGQPENPVPGPGGAVYAYAASPAVGGGSPQAANGFGAPFDESDFSEAPGANGTADYAPPNASGVSAAFAPPSEEPEAVRAMKEHLRTRMREGEEKEAADKKKAEDDARQYLEDFYEQRNKAKQASIQEHREAHKLLGDQKAEGSTEWERAISLIDFNFTTGSTDKSRYRNVLFTAREKHPTVLAAKK